MGERESDWRCVWPGMWKNCTVNQEVKPVSGSLLWTRSKQDSSWDSTSLLLHTYIAVYIQGLFIVYNSARVRSTVAVLGLAINQGRRQPPQYLKSPTDQNFLNIRQRAVKKWSTYSTIYSKIDAQHALLQKLEVKISR